MTQKPSYVVEIYAEPEDQPVVPLENLPLSRLESAVKHVLSAERAFAGAKVVIIVADDAYVQALNHEFRGVDAPTDVLSFPADPLPDSLRAELIEAGEDDALHVGDLVFGYPYTLRHATESGHTLDDELTLLAVHGTLHLLGYDHDTPAHQAAMWTRQADALRALNVPIDVPLFTFGEDATAD